MLISNYIYFTECSKTHALVQKKARGKVRDLTGPKKNQTIPEHEYSNFVPCSSTKATFIMYIFAHPTISCIHLVYTCKPAMCYTIHMCRNC